MKVLLNLSIQYLATRDKILSIDHYVTEKMKSDAIFTSVSAAARARRTELEHISFPLYKQGTDARRLHYFLGIAALEQGIEMCWIFLESLVECQ